MYNMEFLLVLLAALSLAEAQSVKPVNFYRYRNRVNGDNIYMTGRSRASFTTGKHRYILLGSIGKIYPTQVEGTKPLHRFVRTSESATHIYSAFETEVENIKKSSGWKYEKIAGYCYLTPKEGTVPLYRYRKGGVYLYTAEPSEGTFIAGTSRNGYVFEGIACYLPQNVRSNWKSQWKADLEVILGDTAAKQEYALSTNIYTYLTSKYTWRDWLVIVYPDMYGDDNHWRKGCFVHVYTVNKIHWKGRYNILVSSVDKNKPEAKFDESVTANLGKDETYDARSIYENLPGKAKSCRYPLAGVVKAEGTFAMLAPKRRNFHQVVQHKTIKKDCWFFCKRMGFWHVFVLG